MFTGLGPVLTLRCGVWSLASASPVLPSLSSFNHHNLKLSLRDAHDMETYQRFVCLLLAVFLCVEGDVADESVNWDDLSDPSCPSAGELSPCVCFVLSKSAYLDCSAVESEEELAEVFSRNVAFPPFKKLTIENNTHLKVLRAGALGNVSFEEVFIHGGVLEEVENGSLSASYSTALKLNFGSNYLTSFNFDDIQFFTRLQEIVLDDNKLYELPHISSNSLTSLSIGKNPLSSLSNTAFADMPELRAVSIFDTGLNNLFEGTFVGLANLTWLDLSGNELTHLHIEAIQVRVFGASIHLDHNSISVVLPGGVTGLKGGFVYLYNNKISVLEEEVWRAVLEEGNTLDFKYNPLACGCDIAWLVRNTTLLKFVDSMTTCENGDLLADLDPAYYAEVC
ncbi:oplophorus-luciferin 2-monooxygenase non-catalytic subunit [Procambarus clarkii]|uniref:oplophorus-luciferin 2-monooxygenase non-catalytic subunit n=1 Tax=Procambarus clarkii TaxID=6728 RepID=UPI001E678019|nr:oplophorus-luciferin 2-monooxygenase non-catalytic subunit-like [Procambarus clarkii]